MAIVRGLAAAALVALSMTGAAACDDFDDGMALAGATNAAKLAQSPIPQQFEHNDRIANPIPNASALTGTGPAEQTPAPTQITENLAGPLRQ